MSYFEMHSHFDFPAPSFQHDVKIKPWGVSTEHARGVDSGACPALWHDKPLGGRPLASTSDAVRHRPVSLVAQTSTLG